MSLVRIGKRWQSFFGSSAQCKIRYHNLKKKTSVVWSIDEDRKLVQLLGHQTSSVDYAGIAQHFPDKNRQHIRSRCITLRKWMKLNPSADIANAPRRASRNLHVRVTSHDLKGAIKRLKTRLESEVNDNKIKTVNINSHEIKNDIIKAMISQEEPEEIEEAKCHTLILSDGSDEVQANEQNLKKVLILLRGKINKKELMESPLWEKYKGLLKPDQDAVPVITVKTYSKKKQETKIKVESVPDIWGKNCLPPPTYILPPNYSTITALINLMSTQSISKQSETKNKATHNNKISKNTLYKQQVDLLKDRIITMVLWTLILANQPPELTEPAPYVEKKSVKRPPHFDKGDWNAAAIPKSKTKDKVHKVIDLKKSASMGDINIDLQSVIETTNFDPIKF